MKINTLIPKIHKIFRRYGVKSAGWLLFISLVFVFSSPLYGEESKLKDVIQDKNLPANVNVKAEENVNYDYSLPSGITITDKKVHEGTTEAGGISITGKKIQETEMKLSEQKAAFERITNEINLRKRFNSRTMLRASFEEKKIEENNIRGLMVFEAEHVTGKSGPKIVITGSREEKSNDNNIKNSYRARVSQDLGRFGTLEFSGGEEIAITSKKTRFGAKYSKDLTKTINVGLSRDTEFSLNDNRKDRTSLNMKKDLGSWGALRARYQLTEDLNNTIPEDKLNLTYEQKVFDDRLKVIAGYEVKRRETETQKASIGLQKETSVGNNGAENGVFMGVTSRF
jgi:hypothetical protein